MGDNNNNKLRRLLARVRMVPKARRGGSSAWAGGKRRVGGDGESSTWVVGTELTHIPEWRLHEIGQVLAEEHERRIQIELLKARAKTGF